MYELTIAIESGLSRKLKNKRIVNYLFLNLIKHYKINISHYRKENTSGPFTGITGLRSR